MYKGLITEDMTKCHPLCMKMLDEPHVLIAGTTGSGKSVMLNSMIYTAMRTAVDAFYFIDLKRTELRTYKKLYNCAWLCNERAEVIPLLDLVIKEMHKRFKKMRGKIYDGDPIYVFIDELAHLVNTNDRKQDNATISRLAEIGRLGRAANVHLICATQDPSRKTLPASLMQNFTCTLALRCRSSIESRQIVGVAGAEKLPRYGKGYLWSAEGISEVAIPMTPDEDIEAVAKALSTIGQWLICLHRRSGMMYTVDPEYETRIKFGCAKW